MAISMATCLFVESGCSCPVNHEACMAEVNMNVLQLFLPFTFTSWTKIVGTWQTLLLRMKPMKKHKERGRKSSSSDVTTSVASSSRYVLKTGACPGPLTMYMFCFECIRLRSFLSAETKMMGVFGGYFQQMPLHCYVNRILELHGLGYGR